MKRILYFTKGDNSVASSNERVWIIADYLKTHHGYFSTVISSRAVTTKKAFRTLWQRKYDVLVVHKSMFSSKIVALIILAKIFFRVPFIYDLDDAQWLHSPLKSKLFVYVADTVFAGSHFIIDWAKQYNKNVIHMPTLIDFSHFSQFKVTHKKKQRYTIGWVGGGPEHFKTGNLQIVRPALEMLGKKGYPFRFYIIGTRGHKELEEYFMSPYYELRIDPFVPYADVPKNISEFDVGVMPLRDIPFERGKCAAKAIQYMACGIPPVVSLVGENTIVVEQGKTGFLANTTEEWVAAFEKLLSDPSLRTRVGEAGMEKVKNEYSHEAVLKRYVKELEALSGN